MISLKGETQSVGQGVVGVGTLVIFFHFIALSVVRGIRRLREVYGHEVD